MNKSLTMGDLLVDCFLFMEGGTQMTKQRAVELYGEQVVTHALLAFRARWMINLFEEDCNHRCRGFCDGSSTQTVWLERARSELMKMEKKVYIVLKNADFTEGRGPMLFNSAWDNLPAAEAFVLSQPGIYGSKQGKERDGVDPTYRTYNGYVIRQVDVLSRYNPQAKKDAEDRFRKASEEMRQAEAELKKFQ